MKAFADDKINLNEKLKLVFGRVENIVSKGENPCHQHFLLFPQHFQKDFVQVSQKSGLCGNVLNGIILGLHELDKIRLPHVGSPSMSNE